MSNQEDDDVQKALFDLELAIRTQVEKSMTATDMRVSTQRSRFYKFWCYVIFGHLQGPNNTCLRCQKKLNTIQIKSK